MILSKRLSCLIIASALSFLPTSFVSASVLEFDFGGVIDSGTASTGRFSGSLIFDPTTARTVVFDINPPTTHWYDLGPESTLSVQIEGQAVYSTAGDLEVGLSSVPTNYYGDGGPAFSGITIRVTNVADRTAPYLFLNNQTQNVLPSLALPSTLNLADFPERSFLLAQNPGGVTLWSATLDTLTVVPEPRWSVLLCLAIAGGFAFRQCHSRI